jgi:hypothetical protein
MSGGFEPLCIGWKPMPLCSPSLTAAGYILEFTEAMGNLDAEDRVAHILTTKEIRL